MCPHQGGHLLSTCCRPRARPGARSRDGIPAESKGLLSLQSLQSGARGGGEGCLCNPQAQIQLLGRGAQKRGQVSGDSHRSVPRALRQLGCQQDGLRGEKGCRPLADSFVPATLPLLRAQPSPPLQEVPVPSLQGSQAEG